MIKFEVDPAHAMRAYEGMEVYLHAFSTSTLPGD
jgi:hypothetical protein